MCMLGILWLFIVCICIKKQSCFFLEDNLLEILVRLLLFCDTVDDREKRHNNY
jgi:hypothetical protein